MSEPAWRASRRKRAELALISGLGYPLLAALGSTYRYVVDGLDHLRAAEGLGHPIHAFWHGRILPGTFYFRRRGIVVITSENFDGEWTARGSSSRGALKAMLQLLRDVKDRPVAFTLDGPRGPARVAQPGALWLSKATGNPIIPFHLEADRHWTMKSWDRSQIPKPFARVGLAFAPPMVVPRDTDGAALDGWRVRLEAALADCERRSAALVNR
jgi:lysophospholipid acyltransferase (LPLAT)-like uncharacterized protein